MNQSPSFQKSPLVILVTGWRQAGKTTLLLKLREAALGAGLSVGGFLSVARFGDGGEKIGIDVMDVKSGEQVPLAMSQDGGAVRTGKYRFDADALRSGQRFAEAGREADVFFVDELGPLELVQGEGWIDVIELVRGRTRGITFVVVRPELLELARERLGLPADSPCLTVEETNRDDLANTLGVWLGDYGSL